MLSSTLALLTRRNAVLHNYLTDNLVLTAFAIVLVQAACELILITTGLSTSLTGLMVP